MPLTKPDHKFSRMLKESVEFQIDQRKLADESWDFVDGVQWTKEETKELDDRHQQASVINLCFPTVNGLMAVESARKVDYVVQGMEPSDDAFSEVLTSIHSKTINDSDYKYLESQVFRDACIAGIGWFEVATERDIDTKEKFVKIHKHCWEQFYYDPFAVKPDLSDARYIMRQIWMDIDEIEEKWGKEKTEGLRNAYTEFQDDFKGQEYFAQSRTSSQAFGGGGDEDSFFGLGNRRAAVYETYYKDAAGKVKYVIWAWNIFLHGTEDGENKSKYKYNYIPFIPCIAFRDKKGRPKGLIDFIIPIQRSINKAHSKWQWIMSSLRVLWETGSFTDPDMARQEISRPDAYIEVSTGALQGKTIQIDKAGEESQNLMSMIQFLIAIIQRISGINDALIGVGGTNARSGVQEQSRILQGSSQQTPVIDNLRFTRKRVAEIVLKQIGQFYTNERVIRITQPNGTNEFIKINGVDPNGKPFNKIDDILKFDIDLREELPFTNQRELSNRNLSEIMKSAPELIPALIIPFIENLNISRKEKIIAGIEQIMFNKQQDEQKVNEIQALTKAGLKPNIAA